MTKVCTKCGKEKDIEAFPPRKDKNYRFNQCYDCKLAASKAWKKNNPKYFREWAKKFREENRRQADNYRLRSRYGISLREWEKWCEDQNYCCALCQKPAKLYIDHDHSHNDEHGKRPACRKCIRGLLCSQCNGRVLPTLERNPHLQNEFVRRYLKSRPFASTELTSNAKETSK